MRCTLAYAVATALPLITALGCGGATPVGPSPASTNTPIAGPLRIEPRGNEVPLGQVHLRLDSDAGTVEAAPVRVNQAIGDAFLVGLSGINETCDCFTVRSVDREPTPTGARITLDVAFRHPFQLAQRPDLFGWDLKAIVATDRNALNVPLIGRAATGFDGPGIDGYTGEWTPQIRSAIPTLAAEVFPFAILGKDPAVVDPFDFTAPAGWNVFPSGATNTGTLSFDLTAGETMDVDIFFTVGYQASATRPTRQTPQYMPPTGNSRAPWQVAVTVPTNDLSVTGGLAQLDIDIWDWQHGQSLGSDVTAVNVHAPELVSSPIVATLGGGSGREADPLTATATIPNNLQTFVGGDAWALVEVIDALHGANPGGTGGNPGQTLVEDDLTTIGDLQEIRTFQMVRLPVLSNLPGQDPIAAVVSTPPASGGVLTVTANNNVLFDASSSSDPDPGATPEGTIVDYEWDFEWNGIPANFVDDVPGVSGPNQSHIYTVLGNTHLGLRVTDGVGRKSAILDLPVVVTNTQLVLTLDPIQDFNVIDNLRREYGAALLQRTNGDMAVNFTAEQNFSPGNYYAQQVLTTLSGGVWSSPVGDFGSSGGLEYGWVVKTAPGWINGNALGLHSFTDRANHTVVHDIVFGFHNPPSGRYGINSQHSYGHELACSPIDGTIYTFGDVSSQIRCYKGGQSWFDLPVFMWAYGGLAHAIVDARPSQCSRSRSSWCDATGRVHLAYRAQDGSQLRYAYDADGDNLNWVINDLATGAPGDFKDPALDSHGGIAHLAVDRVSGGSHQIQYFRSTNNGDSWSAPLNVGATFGSEPTEVSISGRTILGHEVIVIGYFTGSPSQYHVRWSKDAGASWAAVPISPASSLGDYGGDSLLSRNSDELMTTFSSFDGSSRSNVMARRGVFSLQ